MVSLKQSLIIVMEYRFHESFLFFSNCLLLLGMVGAVVLFFVFVFFLTNDAVAFRSTLDV